MIADLGTPRVVVTVYPGDEPSHEETLADLATDYTILLGRGWKMDGLTERRIAAIRWALAQLGGPQKDGQA